MVPQVYGYGAFGIGLLLGYTGLVQAIAQGYVLGKVVKRFGEVRVLEWARSRQGGQFCRVAFRHFEVGAHNQPLLLWTQFGRLRSGPRYYLHRR